MRKLRRDKLWLVMLLMVGRAGEFRIVRMRHGAIWSTLRTLLIAVPGLFLAFVLGTPAWAEPFPQLLPGAGHFELTLREDSSSSLPLGASCGGEAGRTLACRAFVVVLKNVGVHTVHVSRIACQEPIVNFEIKQPNSSSGWWPISQVSNPPCAPWGYENLRLRPGETTEFRTRLISRNRPAEPSAPVAARSYTVRAHWLLWGCTENPEGADCLVPLQVLKENSGGGRPTGDVEFQTPVEIVSKEIEVDSPALPSLGPLQIGFEISVAPEPSASCAANQTNSVECTLFHFAIRNLGDRPIRNGRDTCSDFSMMPEYRANGGAWKQLQSRLMACAGNIYIETPILPGEAVEGDFTLATLAPRFDTSPLSPPGKYQIRVGFHANACFASPDGSFCIQTPKEQPVAISNVVSIDAGTFIPSGAQ